MIDHEKKIVDVAGLAEILRDAYGTVIREAEEWRPLAQHIKDLLDDGWTIVDTEKEESVRWIKFHYPKSGL